MRITGSGHLGPNTLPTRDKPSSANFFILMQREQQIAELTPVHDFLGFPWFVHRREVRMRDSGLRFSLMAPGQIHRATWRRVDENSTIAKSSPAVILRRLEM